MTENQTACPSCGYCPSCGRRNAPAGGWTPYPYPTHVPWIYPTHIGPGPWGVTPYWTSSTSTVTV